MSPTRPDHSGQRSSLIAVVMVAVMLASGLILGLACTRADAANSNPSKQLPIHIQANHADFSQKSGVSTYTGQVRLTRGELTLTGDKLVVTQIKQHRRVKAVLTGNPAHIDKQPDSSDNEVVTGHAHQIVYTNANSMITLRGHAVVNRNGDQIRGAVITHDLDTGTTHAERGQGSNERVHITIQPGNHDHS